MPKENQITKKDIQTLLDVQAKNIEKNVRSFLNEQTATILGAVDERIQALDLKFTQRIDELAARMDDLTTTLDKFLKRMTGMEDEFAMMKHDLNKMKRIIREKLGVDLT